MQCSLGLLFRIRIYAPIFGKKLSFLFFFLFKVLLTFNSQQYNLALFGVYVALALILLSTAVLQHLSVE